MLATGTASDNDGAVRWEPRGWWAVSNHPLRIALLGGVDAVRPGGGRALSSESGLCVLHGWTGRGHLLLVLC